MNIDLDPIPGPGQGMVTKNPLIGDSIFHEREAHISPFIAAPYGGQVPTNPPPFFIPQPKKPENADKYPQYFRSVMGITHLDVYGVHKLFNVQDPSGCIQHASKKLLLSGVRTGGKSAYNDIKEARDTLNRWLELYANSPESS